VRRTRPIGGGRVGALVALLVLLTGAAPAGFPQTIHYREPNAQAALSRLADIVTHELPLLAPAARGLEIRPARPHRHAAAAELERRLAESGFAVLPAASGRRAVFILGGAAGEPFTLRCEAEPSWRRHVAFGDAEWATRPSEDRILVKGPWRGTVARAHEAARQELRREVARRAGLDSNARGLGAAIRSLEPRRFTAERTELDLVQHRTYLDIRADDQALATIRAWLGRVERAEREEFWARVGLGAILSLALCVGYIALDLATKGYMTWRLRLLLAALIAAGWAFALQVSL